MSGPAAPGRAASCPGGAGRVPAGPSGRRAQAPRAGDPPARVAGAGGAWAARGARAASGAPRRGWTGKGCSAGPSPPPHEGQGRARKTRSGSQGAARWTVRGRLCRGLGSHRARCVPGSALGARCGPRGSRPAGGRRGPAPGPRRLGPTLPGDVSLEAADAGTQGDCFPSSKRADTGGPRGLRVLRSPALGPPGQGAPSARVTERTAAGFAFLAATSRRGPATVARCQARSAAQGPSQAAGPARVSQPPARADLVGLQCLQTHN